MATPIIKQANKHFVSTLYEGNGTAIGSGGKTISGLEFQPDLVWIKNRDASASHALYDSSRGATKQLESDQNSAETTESEGLTSYTSDGFTLGSLAQVNTNNQSFVGWNWKAGGTTPSKTYTVKVVSDGGNKYRFDDFGTSAVTLDLQEGGTYTFDVSDSSVDSHPFVIGTSANSNEYSSGVTYKLDSVTKTYSEYTSGFSSATSRQLIFTVPNSAPSLYYWCSVHSGMGGSINTNTNSGSSNFDGNIQSTVNNNTDAGFSIVTYAGSSSGTATIGHSLLQKPEWIMIKNLTDSRSWFVYHKDLSGANYYVSLNSNSGQSTSDVFNNTAPTPSVFSIQDASSLNTNGSGKNYVAYCWHGVDGFSKIGKYVGNGSSTGNGTYVNTGFKPTFVMLKSTGSGDWNMYDSTRSSINPTGSILTANSSYSEATVYNSNKVIDILSNGFKLRGNNSNTNANNTNFIYMAFGDPFVGDGVSPATAR